MPLLVHRIEKRLFQLVQPLLSHVIRLDPLHELAHARLLQKLGQLFVLGHATVRK